MNTVDDESLQNIIRMAKEKDGTVRVQIKDLAMMAEEILQARRIRLKVMLAIADSDEEMEG